MTRKTIIVRRALAKRSADDRAHMRSAAGRQMLAPDVSPGMGSRHRIP